MEGRRAFVGVGTNIHPEVNLQLALEKLIEKGVQVRATSTVWRTPAIDRPEQADYLNCIWQVVTALEPRALRDDVLRPVEADLGRVREEDTYAARCMDLDILLYDTKEVHTPDLEIPDPDIQTRAFLAAGLQELDPDLPVLRTAAVTSLLATARKTLIPVPAVTQQLRKMIAAANEELP